MTTFPTAITEDSMLQFQFLFHKTLQNYLNDHFPYCHHWTINAIILVSVLQDIANLPKWPHSLLPSLNIQCYNFSFCFTSHYTLTWMTTFLTDITAHSMLQFQFQFYKTLQAYLNDHIPYCHHWAFNVTISVSLSQDITNLPEWPLSLLPSLNIQCYNFSLCFTSHYKLTWMTTFLTDITAHSMLQFQLQFYKTLQAYLHDHIPYCHHWTFNATISVSVSQDITSLPEWPHFPRLPLNIKCYNFIFSFTRHCRLTWMTVSGTSTSTWARVGPRLACVCTSLEWQFR
jgi:hypothetical protein